MLGNEAILGSQNPSVATDAAAAMPQVLPFVMDGWRRNRIPSLTYAAGDEIEASVQRERLGCWQTLSVGGPPCCPNVLNNHSQRLNTIEPSVLHVCSMPATIQG